MSINAGTFFRILRDNLLEVGERLVVWLVRIYSPASMK